MARNKPLMVKVSEPLKDAIDRASKGAGQNMSEWARIVLAQAAGYDLGADAALEGRGRPLVYTTPQERAKARRQAEDRRKRERDAVVNAVMRQQRLENRAALEAWLISRGISLDDDESTDTPTTHEASVTAG